MTDADDGEAGRRTPIGPDRESRHAASWSWDHLRFFLALADAGTLSGAARGLGVSHTTVLRRIRAFETSLGTSLFDRTDRGYLPTASGEALHAEAVQMRAAIDAVSRRIGGADAEIRGEVTITTTDTLAFCVVPPLLAELDERYPDLHLSLSMRNRMSDIANREADIAIRTGRAPPDRLIGRCVGTVRFAACASRDYVAAHALERFPENVEAHRFVALDARYAGVPFHDWLEGRLTPEVARTTASGLLVAAGACRAGMGIAVLPTYLLREEPELVELPVAGGIETNELWVLSRAGLRDTERVRVVRRHLCERLSALFD